MNTRKYGHPLGSTSWCPDCELAEARKNGEFPSIASRNEPPAVDAGEKEAKSIPMERIERLARGIQATKKVEDSMALVAAFLRECAIASREEAPAAAGAALAVTLPAYGSLPWATVRAYVEAAAGSAPIIDPEYSIGHQVVGIDFNSLNRIMSALAATPAPEVPKWIDDPHDIEQGQMLNPAWLKR